MHIDTEAPPNFIPVHEVRKRLGHISRTTIWRMYRHGDFPPPVRVSPGRVMWVEEAVNRWIEGRLSAAA